MEKYRVTISIRRKGEGVFEGMEYKTEHFNDIDDLLDAVDDFIELSIADDMEGRDD